MRRRTAAGVARRGRAGRARHRQPRVDALHRHVRRAPVGGEPREGEGAEDGRLSASEALELATLGSARAIGLEGKIGTLTPGKSADLAVVSLAGSPYFSVEDPAAAVVFGGSPERVRFTLVQGDIRYEKGVTEWHELTVAASRARARMLEAVAEPVRELP